MKCLILSVSFLFVLSVGRRVVLAVDTQEGSLDPRDSFHDDSCVGSLSSAVESLWDVAKAGDVERLSRSLLWTTTVNFTAEQPSGDDNDDAMYTPLMIAAKFGHAEVATMLITAGADVNHQDEQLGRTALMVAAKYANAATVKALIDAGADTNLHNNEGRTALIEGAHRVHPYGPENYPPSRSYRSRRLGFSDNPEIVQLLVQGGASIDATDHDASTALNHAAAMNHIATVETLIRAGASVHASDVSGMTALMWAATSNFNDTVQVLIDANADINAQNLVHMTALAEAASEGYTATVQTLLKAGAAVDLRDGDGGTALTHAAGKGYTAVVQQLAKAGADLNVQDERGETPLMKAARADYVSTVRVLLEAGATLDLRDNNGKTAADHAKNNAKRVLLRGYVSRAAEL